MIPVHAPGVHDQFVSLAAATDCAGAPVKAFDDAPLQAPPSFPVEALSFERSYDMKTFSRGTWLALAAVAAIPATVAIAATAERGGWMRPSAETMARLEEGKLAMAKTALKLTPEQEKLWAPLEASVRDAFKARQAKRDEWQKMREERQKERAEGKRPDLAERFDKMSANMTERSERMKTFSAAFRPFYASLSDEQKDVLRPLMRDLAPGMDGRGKGRHGRFAEGKGHHGGWGWGGHGRGHHGWGDGPRHEMRGGPGGPGGAGGPEGGAGGPPAGPGPGAPQFAPDIDGGDEQGLPPGDNL